MATAAVVPTTTGLRTSACRASAAPMGCSRALAPAGSAPSGRSAASALCPLSASAPYMPTLVASCTLPQLARSVTNWVRRTTPAATPYDPRAVPRCHWWRSAHDVAPSCPVVYLTRQLM